MNIPYAILSALIASEVIAVGSAQYLKNVDSWWNDSCQVWSGGGVVVYEMFENRLSCRDMTHPFAFQVCIVQQ